MDLRRVKARIGAPAAERDSDLQHYFVESEAFKSVAEKSKTILLGNRGSGKSAIFQMVSKDKMRRGALVLNLSPDEYSYQLLQETLAAEASGSWAKTSAYSAAWKYLIYVLVMQAITDRHGGKVGRGSLGEITAYVPDHHPSANMSKLSTLIGYLKRLEGVKIGPAEAGLKARRLDSLYRLEEIHHLLPALNKVLADQEVLVFVDELDRGWDGGEGAQAFVAGLFQACVTIRNSSPDLTVCMSLRQELYDNIPSLYEDAQKYRDLIETVTWDEDGLRRLMGARLRHAYENSSDDDDYESWQRLYSETLSYRKNKSFNYVIDRTLYRPREMISFTTKVVGAGMSLRDTPPFDYQVISEAESTYSEERAKDIAAEYRFQNPGLLSVFETFRGKVHTFDRDELQLHLLEICVGELTVSPDAYEWAEHLGPEDFLLLLWRVGFLRAQAVGGIKARRRSGSSYLGPHQIGNLSLANIKRFQIHPMFRSYLGVKEPKGGRGDESPPGDSEQSQEA